MTTVKTRRKEMEVRMTMKVRRCLSWSELRVSTWWYGGDSDVRANRKGFDSIAAPVVANVGFGLC